MYSRSQSSTNHSPCGPVVIFALAVTAGLISTPHAVAQQYQNSGGEQTQTAAPDNGIPKNLTPQQKYLRDVFLYKKLKEIDEMIKSKHYVQARQMLEELVTLDPNPYSKDVHGLLAECCFKLGNNPETVKHYELAIKYDDDKSVQPYWNIALAYINMNKFDEATKWCKKLLSKNPPADLRKQAERFLADLGREKTEQQAAGETNEGASDYLANLEATKEANRWPREKLPVKVFIEDDRKVPGFRPQFVAIFLNCLEVWTKATQHRLSFQVVDNLDAADMNVIFTANADDIARMPGMAPAEQGLATIHAYTTGSGYGKIEKAKVQLLVHKPGSDTELTDDEMKEVCLHEIGHALGLSGHSPNDADVMHFMMSFRQLPALTKRDKQTISRLYQDYPSLNQNASSSYQPSNMASSPQYQPQMPRQQFPQQQQFPPQQQFNQQQFPPQQQFPQQQQQFDQQQFPQQQQFQQQPNQWQQTPYQQNNSNQYPMQNNQ